MRTLGNISATVLKTGTLERAAKLRNASAAYLKKENCTVPVLNTYIDVLKINKIQDFTSVPAVP